MATRATYKMKSEDGSEAVIYKHWDNYPEEASLYFYKSFFECGDEYILAENFMRANKDARLTESHEIHEDTEYRYDLEKNHLKAWRLTISGSDDWQLFFDGDLDEFIYKYGEDL